jgi:hypothetical protein
MFGIFNLFLIIRIALIFRPGIVYTFQALSENDRKAWMDAMDGREPVRHR